METRYKNLLIGGLFSLILVMAIGYSAFATQLNINGTAEITSKWDVHFDNTKTSGAGVIDTTTGLAGATAPTGTIAYGDNDLTATLNASLTQPGDKVVYTLTVKNAGTLKAQAATPTLALTGGTVNGLTATKGHIKYTVTAPTPTTIAADGSATMTVTAEFTDVAQNATTTTESATLNVTLSYTQATA